MQQQQSDNNSLADSYIGYQSQSQSQCRKKKKRKTSGASSDCSDHGQESKVAGGKPTEYTGVFLRDGRIIIVVKDREIQRSDYDIKSAAEYHDEELIKMAIVARTPATKYPLELNFEPTKQIRDILNALNIKFNVRKTSAQQSGGGSCKRSTTRTTRGVQQGGGGGGSCKRSTRTTKGAPREFVPPSLGGNLDDWLLHLFW
jgi:hypothetical protein